MCVFVYLCELRSLCDAGPHLSQYLRTSAEVRTSSDLSRFLCRWCEKNTTNGKGKQAGEDEDCSVKRCHAGKIDRKIHPIWRYNKRGLIRRARWREKKIKQRPR